MADKNWKANWSHEARYLELEVVADVCDNSSITELDARHGDCSESSFYQKLAGGRKSEMTTEAAAALMVSTRRYASPNIGKFETFAGIFMG